MTHRTSDRGRFEFDGWLADPAACTLTRMDGPVATPDAAAVKLEPKTMEVLVVLAARQTDVVSQEDLERAVWAGVIVTPQSVYQSIAQLRRALGDEAKQSRYIETVPRRGYRLRASVRWHTAQAPPPGAAPAEAPPALRDPAPSPAATPTRSWRRVLLATATIIAATALLLVVAWFTRREGPPAMVPAIAVLPLRDLGGDTSLDYLAESLAEELTHALGQVPGLRVSARTSAPALAAFDDDPTRIGQALGVTHLLRGSLRRNGDGVRVVVGLVDTRSGYQAWSATYERPGQGFARLPAEIAAAVAGQLRLVLGASPGVGGSRSGTRSPTAYDYYMLGQQRYAERTPFALAEAGRYFEQAIEADPAFAAAYVGAAGVHSAEYYFAGRSLAEAVRLMDPLLARALSIDPQYGPALAMRGWVAMETGDYARAERELTAAIKLAPNYSRAYLWLGMALSGDGQLERSLQPLRQAVALDPMNFIVHVREGIVLDLLGRAAEAELATQRAATLAPNHPNPRWLQALLASSRGDLDATIRGYEAALALAPERDDLRIQLATLLLDSGRETQARNALLEAARSASGSETYLLARAELADLDGRPADVAAIAESLASLDPRSAFLMARAGDLLVRAGRPREALRMYDRSLDLLPAGTPLRDLWYLRWGRESSALLRAAACFAADQPQRGHQVLDEYAATLERFEHAGLRHWGLNYQRAGIAALRGDTSGAVAELARARAGGWFRSNWALRDPALAALRGDPRFAGLLTRQPAD